MASRFSFAFHFFLLLLAWVGPMLFTWYYMLIAYTLVTLQFVVFEKCLLNAGHGLIEEKDPDATFYSELFATCKVIHNRKRLKRFVRSWLYPLLALWTTVLQLVLGWKPLLF